MDLIHCGLTIAQDPKHTAWIGPLLVLGDAALSMLIVHKIPCKFNKSNISIHPLLISENVLLIPMYKTPKSTGAPTWSKSPSTSRESGTTPS
jgi:hypothetical protein